ncbi:carboxymuconolactone decarboxylase family protein [Rhizobium leguminosarum bv. viciae]|uniref:carboxymuconolactone decarboxylase family protein n=1 Tax=Rhizobium leguminosarum TaxID=384 RepID=UPI00144184EB|nr:carboxymuconolactone decarboxylase family protein [Rhizobium leguminosarum]NKJ94744.1 carboxymuconolactone decarboxylase family protein [Rhizobium leguminosarum bv. viciae]NKK87442.1 carboxymuconolactone decarboxylase family protein [Rhizobium leguminosarum bv. viciae]
MRLERLTPDRLTDEQLSLYDTIAGGPRAQGKHFPLVDAAGGLTGPFGIMLHVPALGLPLQELGAAIRYRTGLSDRIREIAILCVAAGTDSAFERYAHERVGRAAGLRDAELRDLVAKRFVSADPVESAAYVLCQRLLASQLPMSEEDYGALRGILGEAAIFELVTLVGYYRTLAQLLHVFDVGVPEDSGA